MDTSTVLAIVIPALVLAGGALAFTVARRSDSGAATGSLSSETKAADRGPVAVGVAAGPTGREVEAAAKAERSAALVQVDSTPPAPYIPPDPDELGVTRRQFLNRSIITAMSLALGGFGASVLAFLWPSLSGGFGSKINAGPVDELIASVRNTREPVYKPEGRFYVQPYPADAVSEAEKVYAPSELEGMRAGVVALYQKCPHLGCRVPWCQTSQWFECPCHGSQYNRVGEKKGGPAPRGMDRFPVSVDETGAAIVDTGTVLNGPPIGINTTGQEAEGPNCISSAGGH